MAKKKRKQKGPGRYHRTGITVLELLELFPDNELSELWFEKQRWGASFEDFHCPRCGCLSKLKENPRRKPMPYRCGNCHRHFSVRTGTVMECSNLSYQKWVVAIYLFVTSGKGISSMKMHRELGVTQKTAWFLDHRIREAFETKMDPFAGPVEVDETYIGGKERNKHWRKRLHLGTGGVGKEIVIGMRDRKTKKIKARRIRNTKKETMQSFVLRGAEEGSRIYTDEHKSYSGLARHKAVKHQRGEYVRGKAHTNGIESFWAILKRGYYGIYHHWSPKHLHRYLNEFVGRNNIRDQDTIDQMRHVVAGMVGKRLLYRRLIGKNR